MRTRRPTFTVSNRRSSASLRTIRGEQPRIGAAVAYVSRFCVSMPAEDSHCRPVSVALGLDILGRSVYSVEMSDVSATVSIDASGSEGVTTTSSGLRLHSRFTAIYYETPLGTSPVPPWTIDPDALPMPPPLGGAQARKGLPFVRFIVEVVNQEPIIRRVEIHHPDPSQLSRNLRPVFDHVVVAAAHQVEVEEGGDTFMSEDAYERLHANVRNRRRLITDSLLAEVAQIVRGNPSQPTKKVAEQLFTSHRNATRWISVARQRGYLNEEDANG
jgi:hypothetical protein